MKLPKFFRNWNLFSQILFIALFLGIYLMMVAEVAYGSEVVALLILWIPAAIAAFISAAILDFVVRLLGGSE